MIDYFQIHCDTEIALMVSLGGACPKLGYGAASYRCIPSGAMSANKNSSGGFSLDADATVSCIVSDFSNELPDANEQIEYPFGSGNFFKVVNRTIMAGQKLIRFKLESASQNV